MLLTLDPEFQLIQLRRERVKIQAWGYREFPCVILWRNYCLVVCQKGILSTIIKKPPNVCVRLCEWVQNFCQYCARPIGIVVFTGQPSMWEWHIKFTVVHTRLTYRRTSFNCENLIITNCEFSRVRKLLICKLILLISHPYMQFAQTQLSNSQCS